MSLMDEILSEITNISDSVRMKSLLDRYSDNFKYFLYRT